MAKHGKTTRQYGAEFQIKETGVKYDYSICDDSELDELDINIKELTEKKKIREKFLKSIKGEVFDNNGVKLNAPSKKSTTSVTVKIL